jgi:hypothetical protein
MIVKIIGLAFLSFLVGLIVGFVTDREDNNGNSNDK